MLLCHLILVYVKDSGKSSGRRFAAELNPTVIHLPHNSCKLKPTVPGISSAKVIINTRSGMSNKEEVRRRLAEVFDGSGVTAQITLAESGVKVAELAREAARGDWTVIVAGGGDGTINAVASAVVGSDKILGVLPLGTLNHFARDLKIPNDLDLAARAIASGRIISVDVGEVNGRIFLNNSSLGLYPTMVLEREKEQRLGAGKWPAFVWAAVTVFRRYPFLDVRLSVDGREFRRRTPFVFVGNNEYAMERLNIGLRERLDRGQLSLYITHRTGRWGLIRLALRALFGRLREEKDFLALCTKEIRVQTRHKRLRVAFDGEVDVLETPLHYRVRPGALRVIVPNKEDA
ncbi:MAG TPA: diacylglycerol kinase family protein [Pyrinomonadaceae bacterium]|nr:diacylglycerol kinase family protein [Pyrinomonadaceae bacterium]